MLFLSQPLTTMPGAAGLDERKIVSYLLRALETIALQEKVSFLLLIRPHPREDAAWLNGLRSDVVRVVVSAQGDPHGIILAADLVTGINSVLLVEACYLGCVVASIQIGLEGRDVLPTNDTGYSRAIYDARDLAPALKMLLLDAPTRAAMQTRLREFQPGNAAQRVAHLSYQMLGLEG